MHFTFTVQRALPFFFWFCTVFLQISCQSGCAELQVYLIDSHASLQSSHDCKLNIVAWIVELTYSKTLRERTYF